MEKFSQFKYYFVAVIFLFSALVQAQSSKPLVLDAGSLVWQDAHELPPGAKVAILAGNPQKKEAFVARLKLPANYLIPIHSHPIDEFDTVLSGNLYVGVGNKKDLTNGLLVSTGNFVMIPAKLAHYSWTKEETILQISGTGPWGMIYPQKN